MADNLQQRVPPPNIPNSVDEAMASPSSFDAVQAVGRHSASADDEAYDVPGSKRCCRKAKQYDPNARRVVVANTLDAQLPSNRITNVK